MIKQHIFCEKQIKARLMDRLIEQYNSKKPNDYIICSEMPFLHGKRWADVVVITGNSTTAYEIKSAKDSLKRLPQQIKDYSTTFDKVYLVLHHKFDIKLSVLPAHVGVWCLNKKGHFELKHKASLKKRLLKKSLSAFLWKNDLKKHIKHSNDIQVLRQMFENQNTINEIKKTALSCLRHRYTERFKLFLNERYNKTHVEDLHLLTNKYLKIY